MSIRLLLLVGTRINPVTTGSSGCLCILHHPHSACLPFPQVAMVHAVLSVLNARPRQPTTHSILLLWITVGYIPLIVPLVTQPGVASRTWALGNLCVSYIMYTLGACQKEGVPHQCSRNIRIGCVIER